jgi:excisionase family DNA binding protein
VRNLPLRPEPGLQHGPRVAGAKGGPRSERAAGRLPKPVSPALPEFHTVDEVADRLQLSPRHIRRLIDRGVIPIHRFGRAVRIADDDLRRYLASTRES